MAELLKPKMLGIDPSDEYVRGFVLSQNGKMILKEDLDKYDLSVPVTMRGMTKRKVMAKCKETGRDFYYIDNGYLGNLVKKKHWFRVVKNDVQHVVNLDKKLPIDRWRALQKFAPYLAYNGRRKFPSDLGPIVVVTPSEKPCLYYGIERDIWVEQTLTELKKHTDRQIIVRDKAPRPDRININSIAGFCERHMAHAVVTYQSIAALEAIHYGIPAFTLAPNAADPLCNHDLSKIEDPMYPDKETAEKLFIYLSYCQYNVPEINTGVAHKIIKDYDL